MQIRPDVFTLPLLYSLLLGIGASTLVGCSTPHVAAEALPFDRAIRAAADGLLEQAQPLSGMFAAPDRQAVMLDPTLDADSGQQTSATQQLDSAITERVQQGRSFELMPFEAAHLKSAKYLVVGSISRAEGGHRLDLALLDLNTGGVVAQTSVLARLDAADMKPIGYYRDSPVLMKDETVEGYIRTTRARPGNQAEASYLGKIGAAASINDAARLYNSGRYREALVEYRGLAATPAGNQIRVLSGMYLSSVKLGRTVEAESAFGRLVAYGLAQKNLSVKFLFNPGSTDFWADSRLTSAYGMWLRQIARQASNAKVCMDIVGHTSKTGPEEVNDSLSARRASFIKQKLSAEASELTARTRTVGMGSRHNLVGSGTDDVVDAPDRRVDFAIVDCTA
ncbi:Outer membrane protein-associated (lipo)proteins [Variovorax sp. PBS-H4]|uniref:OmpA family protein n=1 Tax=Variovorax sp. PBS-H4 TaxID=434008 RepID=UPI001315BE0E|nr:OmpA family protein [Variovorax sp. PBS-H4]VTU18672.1 Outer membrane protein-associated (lipo)proteins [Variovorax sp. PBS-H4]